MSGVLVDREALERVLCVFPENPPVRGLGGLPRDLAQAIKTARSALALPAQAAADAAEQEGIMAGLNGCVGTHNPHLFGDAALGDAWERGNARVRAVRDQERKEGQRVAEQFAVMKAASVQEDRAESARRVSPYCTPERLAAGIEATSRAQAYASVYGADAAGVQHFSLEVGEGVILPAGWLRLTSVQDGVGAFEFTPDALEVQG